MKQPSPHPNTKHGRKKHINYPSWNKMMHRCYNKNSSKYPRYGGRGIVVCARWHDINNFIEDMGSKLPGQSIGRINNDGNYSLENCRWETPYDQGRNTSKTVFLKSNGKVMCLLDWARYLGINYSTVRSRWQRGWSTEEILYRKLGDMETPVKYRARLLDMGSAGREDEDY